MAKRTTRTKIDELSTAYLVDLISLVEMVNYISPELTKKNNKAKSNFEKNSQKLLKETPPKKIRKLTIQQSYQARKQLDCVMNFLMEFRRSDESITSFGNSIFVNLFSRFDAYLEDILRHLYSSTDFMLKSDRQLKYSDIANLESKSFSSVKNRFIDEEIDSVRDSRVNKLASIEKYCHKKPKEIPGVKKFFIESCERRNIIVHHNGKISHKYREMMNKYGISVPQGEQTLAIDEEYIQKTINTMLVIAVELNMCFHRNQNQKQIQIDRINDYVLIPLIKNKKYKTALSIIKVLTENCDEIHRRINLVNEALCYKLMNKHNELTKTVAKLEKLKIDSIFKIAVSILKGDESRALNIINKIKTKKELRIVDLNLTQNNNIVFSDLIKTEKYIKIISDKGITPKSIELVG